MNNAANQMLGAGAGMFAELNILIEPISGHFYNVGLCVLYVGCFLVVFKVLPTMLTRFIVDNIR